MKGRAHRVVKRCRAGVSGLLLALAAVVAAGPGRAQSTTDPDLTHRERELSRIEQRAVTDPRGASDAARDALRRLRAEQGGQRLDPDTLRIERRLGELARDGGFVPEPGPPAIPRGGDRLPMSVDPGGGGEALPSLR